MAKPQETQGGLVFTIDRSSAVPLADQVCEGIEQLIASEGFAQHHRMPSVRKLASALGVSAFTVATSYERLASRGIVQPRAGAGYFVSRAARLPAPELPAVPVPAAHPQDAMGFVRSVIDPSSHAVAAGSGFFPRDWMQDALPPAVVGRLLRGEAAFSTPAPAQGLLEFRRQLVVKLAALEINAQPSQIISTFGATHAVHLICRKLLQPGDTVLVEDPSYMMQQVQVLDCGCRLLPVPRLHNGPDLAVLEQLVRAHRPRLFFTQTVLHNPTGGATAPDISFQLLSLARQYDFHIVEDDVLGDLLDRPATRLASLDNFSRVFYVSSFTKVLSPALRLGYVVCPPAHVDALVERKMLDVLSGSALQESLVTSVLKTGRYQMHLAGLIRRLHKARCQVLAELTAMGIEFASQSMDGLFLWGMVPPHVNISRLMADAFQQGILLTHGAMFSPTGGFARHLRFNAAFCADRRVLALLRDACRPPGS